MAWRLNEKTAFLQKHDQALFGKDFSDPVTESLKAKKQSMEAIVEVSRSTNRKRPFRKGPSFQQGRPNGGGRGGAKNPDRTTMVNTSCLKRKKLLYSNSQISLSVVIKIEELTHVHQILKNIFQTKNSKMFLSREEFLPT